MVDFPNLYAKSSHLNLCRFTAINKKKPVIEVDDL